MNLLLLFTILSIVNVIFSTFKSIIMIKAGPVIASLVSAGYYAYYSIVVIYTVADFPLWQKVLITFICNLIGVFIVKYGEARARKAKLWEVRATVPMENTTMVHEALGELPHNYIPNIGKYTIFNIYCATQKESAKVKEILNWFNAKYFVSESKNL